MLEDQGNNKKAKPGLVPNIQSCIEYFRQISNLVLRNHQPESPVKKEANFSMLPKHLYEKDLPAKFSFLRFYFLQLQ